MKQLTTTILIILISITSWSKKNELPLIGDKAPSFTANSTNGILNFPEDFFVIITTQLPLQFYQLFLLYQLSDQRSPSVQHK
jgi:hypothetical protein